VSHFTHGNTSHSVSTTYWYGDNVTLTCDEGYWVMLDKGYHSINFTCSADGYFRPEPLYVKCSSELLCALRSRQPLR